MGEMVDLERHRREKLARGIAERLRRSPDRVLVEDPEHDVERWRRAARRAGRLLGWKVRTGVVEDGRCWVVDVRPPEELSLQERRADELAERSAVRRMAVLRHPPPTS